ncbi:MAG: diguanylate cyclase (GGDEF)-like protein [Gammaproteobacteria bacterium]|jgi:diguanylate cyclase (GGDEF)-like protein
MPGSIPFCGHTILQDKIFIIPDTILDERFADNPIVSGPPHIRFYAGQPLRATDGRVMGTFCILDYQPRNMLPSDLSLLKDLTLLAEKELNFSDLNTVTSRLKASKTSLVDAVTELEMKERRERSRNRCLEMVSRGFPLNQIMESIIREVESQHPELYGCIQLVDEKAQCLRVGSSPSLPQYYKDALEAIPIRVGEGSSGTAAATGERCIIEHLQTHPYSEQYAALSKKVNFASCWSQPIKSVDGRVLGTFSVSTRKMSTPDQVDIELIEQTANLIGIAIERDIADALIHRQANYDALTGLPNRHMLQDRLGYEISKAQRADWKVALFFLDLDHFKNVNDTLGHHKGDQLLTIVAERLLGCVRTIDTVARLGGDEFTVVMGELNDTGSAERVASAILRELSRPFILDSEVVHLSASIGVTFYPDNAEDIETLVKNADQAMYAAKAKGRNQFQYFARAMQEKALARMATLKDLHNALTDNHLQVFYQPIVELDTGNIHKAEALVRWLHPQHGLIYPEEFISVAKESRLIVEVSDRVFQQVLDQLIEWRSGACPEFNISVNTSPIQYRDGGVSLLKWVDRLHKAGMPGKALGIEITEGLLMENRSTVSQNLTRLREGGITISLDDFGTGYSSLSYLQKIQIDYLKIDKSFVLEMQPGSDNLTMCEAIIVMAHKLNLKVIAEGVETELQKQLLHKAGCDYAQEVLFSSPVAAHEFPFKLA